MKKNSQCGLEPENFTFARQPIYEPPAEIVRPAQTRGSNQPAEADTQVVNQTPPPPVSGATIVASPSDVSSRLEKERVAVISATASAGAPVDDGSSLVEGRAKRKRVAPTRFEDEEFAEHSPIKKKPLTIKVEKTPSPQVGAQTTPSIKISIKPTPLGGTKTPIVVTLNHAPKLQPQPATLKIIAPKEKSETPKGPVLLAIKTEAASESGVAATTPRSSNDDQKPAAVNGNTETAREEPAPIPGTSVTITPQPRKASTKKSTPKPSLLEAKLTSQFKP